MTPEISIVTGTRNRHASLRRLAKSIAATASVPTEFRVQDAGDRSAEPVLILEEVFRNTGIDWACAREFPRLGPNKGYNVAFHKCTGKYVCYVNDDSEFIPGWDKIALEFMESHEDVGCGILWWRDPGWKQWNYQTFQGLLFANFGFVRREAGEAVGWFDEREVFVPRLNKVESLHFYGNDVGICLKLIDAGYGVVPIPNCKIIHHREHDETRQENNREFVFGEHGNIAGDVLRELWGGLAGIKRLREKQEKFRHLIPNGEWCN